MTITNGHFGWEAIVIIVMMVMIMTITNGRINITFAARIWIVMIIMIIIIIVMIMVRIPVCCHCYWEWRGEQRRLEVRGFDVLPTLDVIVNRMVMMVMMSRMVKINCDGGAHRWSKTWCQVVEAIWSGALSTHWGRSGRWWTCLTSSSSSSSSD